MAPSSSVALDADGATSLHHVVGLLDALRLRVRGVIDARRSDDPGLDDPFLGLYLTDEAVQHLLASPRVTPPIPEADDRRRQVEADIGGADTRLRRLARSFELDDVDVDLLVVALAPDVDDRFERFYGFLNDDVSRRRASVSLALSLVGASTARATDRARLRSGGPLVDHGLVIVDDLDRPFLTRSLRVPDRIVGHLLGDDRRDPDLVDLGVDAPMAPVGVAKDIAAALGADIELIHLREHLGGGGLELAASGVRLAEADPLVLDFGRLDRDAADGLLAGAVRECRLTGRVLVCGPLERFLDDEGRRPPSRLLRLLTEATCPRVLVSECGWDPAWGAQVPLRLETGALTDDERRTIWQATGLATPEVDPAAATSGFQLSPAGIVRAAEAARLVARSRAVALDADAVRTGAVAQNSARLERLARRIEPTVGFDDLVLPEHVRSQLRRLADRARFRGRVLEEWGMRPGGGRGRGVTALFAGDSGTGKTMSAEVIASSLGLDLYVVNLATVVDKYIGETEKNLDRIFTEAAGVNGVLLFDEADALFGQRSEVKDSHDRYANLEVAYLLQRMEAFDGLAVLSTNLRSNLDDAFARRLDAIIEFPLPEDDMRRVLWSRTLRGLPVRDDVDLDFLADRFELSGGNIRSVAITAAYRAAATGADIDMTCLATAVGEEYRKLGRLCLEAEFGPYTPIVNDRSSHA